MQVKNKVFLGGNCEYKYAGGCCIYDNDYRPLLIEKLEKIGVEYFNPIVPIWNEDSKNNEAAEKADCNIHLYVITSEIRGLYSISEATESAILNKLINKHTVFVLVKDGFSYLQTRSLEAICITLRKHGAIVYEVDEHYRVAERVGYSIESIIQSDSNFKINL